MQKMICFLTILAIASLTGCSAITGGGDNEIVINKDGKVIAGRNQNDGYVGGKEADAKALEALFISTNTPTFTATVSLDDNNKPVMTTSMNIGPLIIASKVDQIMSLMAKQNVPETSFAQGAKAVGGAVTDIVSSPATMAIGLSWLWKDALLGAAAMAGGDNRNYVYRDIDGSFNETKVIGKGTATGPAMGGDTIMEPAPLTVK